jgi:ketosteroid isomerase-like protein
MKLVTSVPVLLALAACGSTPSPQAARAQVISALAGYDSLIVRMDHDGIAATFTRDGETADGDQAPLHGPDAIRAQLMTFAAFHVLANRLDPDSTLVSGDTAWQTGSYRQRVQVPAGDTIEVSGRFTAVWRRTAPARWQLWRMHTFRPQAPQ